MCCWNVFISSADDFLAQKHHLDRYHQGRSMSAERQIIQMCFLRLAGLPWQASQGLPKKWARVRKPW